jgi:hypothetical protein
VTSAGSADVAPADGHPAPATAATPDVKRVL